MFITTTKIAQFRVKEYSTVKLYIDDIDNIEDILSENGEKHIYNHKT